MYRHDALAAHAHIECLRTRVGDLAEDLASAEEARRVAESELDRLREGIGDDPDLPSDVRYRRTQSTLRLLGGLGGVCTLAGISGMFVQMIAEPLWSWRGVQNLWFHIQYGDALTTLAVAGGIILFLMPWLALPWVSALGLRRQRRWGWVLGVIAAFLYLPTPLAPASGYVLTILFSDRVRGLYFPVSRARRETAEGSR